MTEAEDARGLGFATATGHWVGNFSAPDEGRRGGQEKLAAGRLDRVRQRLEA